MFYFSSYILVVLVSEIIWSYFQKAGLCLKIEFNKLVQYIKRLQFII